MTRPTRKLLEHYSVRKQSLDDTAHDVPLKIGGLFRAWLYIIVTHYGVLKMVNLVVERVPPLLFVCGVAYAHHAHAQVVALHDKTLTISCQ